MGVKVATSCFQLSARHLVIPQNPSSSQTLASTKQRLRRDVGGDVSTGAFLACHYPPPRRFRASAFRGTQSTKLHRSKSCELWEFSSAAATKTGTTLQVRKPVRRVCSANLDSFSNEEFSRQIQELALEFRIPDEEEDEKENQGNDYGLEIIHQSGDDDDDGNYRYSTVELLQESVSGHSDSMEPPWREMANHPSIERKANSVDLPLSLRMIKKKLKLEEGLRDASESAYCSVKKAFSSMVFMIEELHSFTLQMREAIFYEDLQGILRRVQKEMHASFVWLFQCVFSHTPTLMVYVMILLANFTVHSMGSNAAIATASAPLLWAKTEASSVVEAQYHTLQKSDSSSVKMYNVSSSGCGSKTTSIGGGSGGKLRRVMSGSDGNGWFDGSEQFRSIIPDGVAGLSPFDSSTRNEESVSGQVSIEEELSVWNSMVEAAERMKDPAIDQETRHRLLSPVDAKIESDDNDNNYFRTELWYQMGLSQEPNNHLLLANYAQFLYLVNRDYDRAEEYFKRAIGSEPVDAETFNKYASFLWRAREDLWAAEEMFLEAISVDPTNPYHASKYASFLWNTEGGEDTCFPLGSSETPQEMA